MRKYIIIISALFLFSVTAYAQDIEKKENVQESNPAAAANGTSLSKGNNSFKIDDADSENDSSLDIVAPQTVGIKTPGSKVFFGNSPMSFGHKSSFNPAQTTSISKTAQTIPPPMQTTVPQTAGIKNPGGKVFSGNPPMPPEHKSSLDPAPSTSITSTNPAIPPLTDVPTNTTSISKGNISLNFDDADIYSVIQTVFSEILKVNYIVDPKVKGRVTFRSVAPVPVDNVLP
jgi:hypothetical protein